MSTHDRWTRPPRYSPTRWRTPTSAKLHAALAHLRANAPVSWVDVPNYRPFWAITKHADIMDIERANMLFTNSPRPVLITAEGDEMQAAVGVTHADPHGRPAAPGGACDRRRLVPPEGHAGDEGSRRRTGQDLRRQDDGGEPRVRLRSAGRGQLPAVRDHVAARPAGVRLPADAQAAPRSCSAATTPSSSAAARTRISCPRCWTCSNTSTR